ncbi:unnamed protein product [Brassica rapa]|uniref:Uncharacterized protein n=1 Tax=Brassica campestris TaxID=3711 RepID=A0A3P5Z7L8_BRACM|nr:unnamed protein product [Brassica rapa]VDC75852.1 unnamed protein product [Brassica rapa]
MGWWEASLSWLRRASKCGKTSLINVVENVGYTEDLDPIVNWFSHEEVIKGNVTFKIWDASGQSRFRSYLGNVLFTLESFCPAAGM